MNDVDPSALAALGQLSHNSTIKPEVLAALAALSHNDFGDLKMATVTVEDQGGYGIPLQQSRTGYPIVCGQALVTSVEPGDVLVEINGKLSETLGFDACMSMLANVRPLTLRFGHPKGTEQKLKYYGQRWRPFKRKLRMKTGRKRESVPVALHTIEFMDSGPLGMRIGQSAVDNAVIVADPLDGTQAARYDVKLGDVILGVGRHLNLQGKFGKTMHYLQTHSRPLKVLFGRPRTRQAYVDYYGSEDGPAGMAPPDDTGITGPLDEANRQSAARPSDAS
eukprot:CAMPEP_0118862996 /NCGR_PEP_ID=MMETSP1163-20130328/8021_1 /TAXON_ID=124430 /ORGANISM="Phaeomonas parva, Strain CCMP2877" /LENGTH=277 /DNA_ID=CAMNT_0006796959 /DNA_START=158 /DNA_END=987 /DNA_ORIENTATION=-